MQERPGIGVKDLAQAMDIHQSTASNLVKTLIRLELIDSLTDDKDRRAICLHLLPAGGKVLRRAPGPLTGVLPEALGKLDHQTLLRLNKDLDQLIALLEVEARAAQIPLSQS
jgi:DNA-binding MarR family transcriptional regulator